MGGGYYREFGYPKIVAERTSRELADLMVQRNRSRACATPACGPGSSARSAPAATRQAGRKSASSCRGPGPGADRRRHHHAYHALGHAGDRTNRHAREFGADLSHVIIGHLGDRIGVQHLLPLAEQGVYLEVDNIGYLDYQPEWVRADNVAALVKEGFGDRVLLSEDICSLRHLKYQGGKGYGYLLEVFVPLLRQRGLKDEDIAIRTC